MIAQFRVIYACFQVQQWGKPAEKEAENFEEKFARGWVWRKWLLAVDNLQGQDLQDSRHGNLGCQVSLDIKILKFC